MKIMLLYMPANEKAVARALEARNGFRVIPCDRRKVLALAPDAEVAVIEDDDSKVTIAFLQNLVRVNPELPVLVLTRSADTVPLLEAGAMLCLDLDSGTETILKRARDLTRGDVPLDPQITGRLLRRLQELSRLCTDEGVDVERCAMLSPREVEVTKLIARGRTNEQIATELGVALGTVKSHLHNILRKLDVENRRQAGAYWRLYRRTDPGASVLQG